MTNATIGGHYEDESTLRPLSAAQLARVTRVPTKDLPDRVLLLYDAAMVDDLLFISDPRSGIDQFLRHAFLGCEDGGGLRVGAESLSEHARTAIGGWATGIPAFDMSVRPLPFLREKVNAEAIAEAVSATEWYGQVSECPCGDAGCGSQYAWFREGICFALFTIKGAGLESVDLAPFRSV